VSQPFDFQGFKHRLEWAKGLHSGRRTRLTNDDVAERVGPILGRTYTGAMVGKWMKDTVPTAAIIQAVATVCGVDPGWLAYGGGIIPTGYQPPSPDDVKFDPPVRLTAEPPHKRRKRHSG
jgi:hypothetical protein